MEVSFLQGGGRSDLSQHCFVRVSLPRAAEHLQPREQLSLLARAPPETGVKNRAGKFFPSSPFGKSPQENANSVLPAGRGSVYLCQTQIGIFFSQSPFLQSSFFLKLLSCQLLLTIKSIFFLSKMEIKNSYNYTKNSWRLPTNACWVYPC